MSRDGRGRPLLHRTSPNVIPGDLHFPSLSSMAVTVSAASCLCSKLVSYWIMTYSPSGGPGSGLVWVPLFIFHSIWHSPPALIWFVFIKDPPVPFTDKQGTNKPRL